VSKGLDVSYSLCKLWKSHSVNIRAKIRLWKALV